MSVYYCEHCEEYFCSECDRDSENVDGETWCITCVGNGAWFCNSCQEYHSDNRDSYSCDRCGFMSCDPDAFEQIEVNHDQEYLCGNCAQAIQDRNLPMIRDYHSDHTWKPIGKESREYIGLELEFNFPDDSKRKILDLSKEILKECAAIWKHDGSLTCGAELCTEPQTYEAFRKCNLKQFLQEAHKEGLRGYKSGECGLHVHISRNALDSDRWILLKLFFMRNQSQIESLSARKNNSYCRTPDSFDSYDWQENKYCCVNFQHRETFEFRTFRGTTNYDRIQASVQFCLAICEYLQQLACPRIAARRAFKEMPGLLDWDCFVDWLYSQDRFPALFARLVHKQLITDRRGIECETFEEANN